MSNLPEIDRLLVEDSWLRRLAGQLVSDPSLADDLAQEAWVTALDQSPHARPPRAWLGRVLRNIARARRRSEQRRQWRERSAARCEGLPSTAELVEEVALGREVADQLLRLDEPFRSTLHLRFFRDLPLKQIAQQMDVPISTVHDRMRCGLEQIRRRLDRRYGGDRSAWAPAIFAFAKRPSGLTTTAIGGILMSTGFKAAASIILVGGALGIIIQSGGVPGPLSPEAIAAPAELAVAADLEAPEDPVLPASAGPERTAVATPEATPPSPDAPGEEVAAETTRVELRGRAIDVSQQPVAGLKIEFRLWSEELPSASTTTDSGGRFLMERDAPVLGPQSSGLNALNTKLAGGQLGVDDPIFNLLAVGMLGTEELVLVVQPKLDLTGIVVDEAREPIHGVSLAVRVRQELYREIGLTQFASFAENGAWETSTDRDGRFTIPEACGGSNVFLDARHAEYAPAKVELPAYASDDLVVVLSRVDGTVEVKGHVLDDAGTPIDNAQVSMGHIIERTDTDGSFTLLWNRADGGGPLFRRDDKHTGDTSDEQGPVPIGALKAGYAPARLELEETDLTSPVLLILDRDELSIAGRTVDPNGKPLPGIVVWARDLTHFGHYVLRQGEYSTNMAIRVEELLRGGLGTRGVTSDEDGRFELEGLMPRKYQIQTCDPLSGALGEGWEIEAGEVGIDLVLRPDPSQTRVAGRVVSAEGAPIPGVEIRSQRSAGAEDSPAYRGPPDHLMASVKTSADGTFEFPALATDGTTLFLYGEGIYLHWFPLEEFEDLARVEIVVPLLCELQVEFESEIDGPVIRLQVLDKDGVALEMVETFGTLGSSSSDSVEIQGGTSSVLRVPETAHTLIILEGTDEVVRHPLDLDIDERTVVRP